MNRNGDSGFYLVLLCVFICRAWQNAGLTGAQPKAAETLSSCGALHFQRIKDDA